MREIVTAVEMKELDHNTIQKAGISSPVLMATPVHPAPPGGCSAPRWSSSFSCRLP